MSNKQRPAENPAQGGNIVVGREDERSRLESILGEVEHGRGRLVLTSGEAGIGKTALIEDLAREADRRGFPVGTGHCYDFLSQSPYAAWIPILRSLNQEAAQAVGSLEGMVTSPHWMEDVPSQEHLYDAVSRLLERASHHRPLLLIIEDIHWADQASLDLLRYLSRHPVELPILMVATYRDTALVRDSYLYRLLPSLIRDSHAVRIELRRLDEPSVRSLVRQIFQLSPEAEQQLTEFVFRLAQGNAFFTWELLHSLEHEGVLTRESGHWVLRDLTDVRIPPLVRQIIDIRLSTLTGQTRQALDIASIIGGDISYDIWRLITGFSEQDLSDVIREAVEAHVLVEMGAGYDFRFSHELVRETLYQELALSQRRSYHRAFGELLAADQDADPGVVATQFRAAADERAAKWLLHAGVRAQAVYAPRDAVIHLTDALNDPESLAPDERQKAHIVRARSYILIGDFDSARFDLESALQLAREQGDRHAEWESTIELGMLWAERDYERIYEYLEQALELARSTGDQVMLGNSLNRTGNWYLNKEEPSRAEQYHLEALQHFTEAGDQNGIADTLDLLGLTRYMGGNLPVSASNLREAIALFRNLDRREGLSSSLVNLMMCGGSHETVSMLPAYEEDEDGIAAGEEALAVAREIGWRAGEAYALCHISSYVGLRGDYSRALETVERARSIAVEISHREWLSASHLTLGWIYLDLLQIPRARAHIEQSRAIGRELNSMFWYRSATAALARVHFMLGDTYRAGAILDECLSSTDGMETIGERSCWLVRADLALASGDAETSMQLVERLIDTAVGLNAGDVIPALWKARAEALLRMQRVDEAIDLLESARDRAICLDWPVIILHIDLLRASVYRSRNDQQRATNAIQDARAIIDRIASQIPDDALRSSFREEASSRLPGISGNRSHSGAFRPLDLTPRELEVLQLVASGQSDREIADQLSISPRTVMNHVGNVFNKLGVNSRAAATAQAIRNDLI